MAFIVNTYTEDGNEVIIGGRADGDEQETLSLAQSLGATRYQIQRERTPIYHMGNSRPQAFIPSRSEVTIAFPTGSVGHAMAVSGMYDNVSMGSRLIGGSPRFFDVSLVSNPVSMTSVSGSISALYDWAERAGALGGTSGCLGCITGSKDIHQHASDCAFTIQMTTPPEAIVPGVF